MNSEQAQSQQHQQQPSPTSEQGSPIPSSSVRKLAWETPQVTASAINDVTASTDDVNGGGS